MSIRWNVNGMDEIHSLCILKWKFVDELLGETNQVKWNILFL
jgi:hypothetical protein